MPNTSSSKPPIASRIEEHAAAIQLAEKGTIGREEDIFAQEGEVRSLEGRVVEANIQLDDTTLVAPTTA